MCAVLSLFLPPLPFSLSLPPSASSFQPGFSFSKPGGASPSRARASPPRPGPVKAGLEAGAGTEGRSDLGRSRGGGAGCWGRGGTLEGGLPGVAYRPGQPASQPAGGAAPLVFEWSKRGVSPLPALYIYNFPLSGGSGTLWEPSRLESAAVKLGPCAFPPRGAAGELPARLAGRWGSPLPVPLLPQLRAGRRAEGSRPWAR